MVGSCDQWRNGRAVCVCVCVCVLIPGILREILYYEYDDNGNENPDLTRNDLWLEESAG